MVFHGLRSIHRLPSSADTYPIPTHQTIQTNVGAKFSTGLLMPNNPVATTSRKTATPTSLRATKSALFRRSAPNTGTASKLYLGYHVSPGFLLTNRPMTTNEAATAAAAATMNRINGIGRS